jgi:enamine deaminase RidA (YjgF/YER057c/UK114 family)
MSSRKNFTTGAKWEDIIGYCRAVQIGNQLEISGTVAADENGVVAKGNVYGQTKFIIQKLEGVLKQAGYSLEDVIRTRIFTTDISKWEEIGKAHGEFFKNIKPATCMVEVSALIDPDYLIEIEISASK